MQGLGDLVYVITKWTGIEYMVHKYYKITGFECGCMDRRRRWNKAFPFKAN